LNKVIRFLVGKEILANWRASERLDIVKKLYYEENYSEALAVVSTIFESGDGCSSAKTWKMRIEQKLENIDNCSVSLEKLNAKSVLIRKLIEAMALSIVGSMVCLCGVLVQSLATHILTLTKIITFFSKDIAAIAYFGTDMVFALILALFIFRYTVEKTYSTFQENSLKSQARAQTANLRNSLNPTTIIIILVVVLPLIWWEYSFEEFVLGNASNIPQLFIFNFPIKSFSDKLICLIFAVTYFVVQVAYFFFLTLRVMSNNTTVCSKSTRFRIFEKIANTILCVVAICLIPQYYSSNFMTMILAFFLYQYLWYKHRSFLLIALIHFFLLFAAEILVAIH